MMQALETLEKLGYTLALKDDGNISIRGRPSQEADRALAVLRADKKQAAACLRLREAFRAGRKGFRIVFDFFEAHFPPTMTDEYWYKVDEDLGKVCEACGSDEFTLDLLCAAWQELERLAKEEAREQ